MQDTVVIVVGAGPSGLATSACLNRLSIPNIVLEREDRFAPIWTKKSYDRLHLHLAKQFCELPFMPFPEDSPTYVSRESFVKYLDDYATRFKISPLYYRKVEEAIYDENEKKWKVKATNVGSGEVEEYSGRFLVVASGETSDEFVPKVEGLENFNGEMIHSTLYKNGEKYKGKSVLVVGSGNSGMEIAYDLSNHGAKTSIVVRSPTHVFTKVIMHVELVLLQYLPLNIVDSIVVLLGKLYFGDLTKYGIRRPKEGPFYMKEMYGKYPVVDVGTIAKIKSGEIQVLPAVEKITNDEVVFENGKSHPFDAIVFATGFKRSTSKWLKDGDNLLNEDGIPKGHFPNHWKGQNGLYCAGLSRRGLYGSSFDAQNIAEHIKSKM